MTEDYEPDREDVCTTDPGRCTHCGRVIPDEDEPYCTRCEWLMTGVDTESDYGGDYDE